MYILSSARLKHGDGEVHCAARHPITRHSIPLQAAVNRGAQIPTRNAGDCARTQEHSTDDGNETAAVIQAKS